MNARPLLLAALLGIAACGGNSAGDDSYLQGVGRIPGAQSVGVEVETDGATLTAPGVQGPVIGSRSTGNRIIVIGDSILAGTSNRYGGEMCAALVPLGWRVAVEAEAGQPASFGREVLRARLNEGWDAAVVFLGTNPSSNIDRFEKDMESIVGSLAPRPTLLLTTTLFRETQKATNEVIRTVAASHDNVSILDWGTASTQPGVLNRDGVHPTTAGRALLVKAVAAAVGNAPVTPGNCLNARFTDDSRVAGVLPTTVVPTANTANTVINATTVPAQTPAASTTTVPAATATPSTTGAAAVTSSTHAATSTTSVPVTTAAPVATTSTVAAATTSTTRP